MENTKQLLKFLFRFKCPKCEASSFEAKPMQDHLLRCKKDYLIEDEIKYELDKITMIPEAEAERNDGNQNFQNDCGDIEFNDIKSPTNEDNLLKPKFIKPIKLEKSRAVQILTDNIEIQKGPKIDKVLSYEEVLAFEVLKEKQALASRSTEQGNIVLNGNQMKKKHVNYICPRLTNIQKENFYCEWPDCEQEFMTTNERTKHHRIHEKDLYARILPTNKTFACHWPNCDRKFARIQDRTIHYRSHTTVKKPYLCHWKGCSKTFSYKKSLLKHSKRHIHVT